MKKILAIVLTAFTILLFCTVARNMRKSRETARWNQTVLRNIKGCGFQFPLCYKSGKVEKIDILSAGGNFSYSISELPVMGLPVGIGECGLSPMIFDDTVYLCGSRRVEIYSISKNHILWEQDFKDGIAATTMPSYKDGTLSFFLLEHIKESNAYRVIKCMHNGAEVSQDFITDIPLGEKRLARKTATDVSFFTVADDRIVFAMNEESSSQILEYSLDGAFVRSLGEGHFIVPNRFDDKNLYYLKEAFSESGKRKCLLMKNNDVIFECDDIIMCYFLDSSRIYLQKYDAWEAERFDFTNGPWPPSEEAFILNAETSELSPAYIKEPWREGNFFERAKIRDIGILFIPVLDAAVS